MAHQKLSKAYTLQMVPRGSYYSTRVECVKKLRFESLESKTRSSVGGITASFPFPAVIWWRSDESFFLCSSVEKIATATIDFGRVFAASCRKVVVVWFCLLPRRPLDPLFSAEPLFLFGCFKAQTGGENINNLLDVF